MCTNSTATNVPCEAKTRLKFPGAYVVLPTIFEQLEDEGIPIPEELRYFKYLATFDFECMFNTSQESQPNNTTKLTWEAKHVPLSVSVCSNVPGYENPKCMVTNSDSHQLLKNLVDYLLQVSEVSYNSLTRL